MGDFNLRTDSFQEKLSSMVSKYDCRKLIHIPTFLISFLFDLLITNQPRIVSNINTVESHISDHLLVETQLFKKKPRLKHKPNLEVLQVQKNMLYCHEQLAYLNTSFLNIFNKHAS